MSKRNVPKGLKNSWPMIVLFGGVFLLILTICISYTPEKSVEDFKKENHIQLEYTVKMTAAYIDSLVSVLKKDSDDIFVHEDFYIDNIIYGDEKYNNANNLETKIYMLKNVIGEIDCHADELHPAEKKYRDVKELMKLANKNIEKANTLLYQYNEVNKTSITLIPSLNENITK